MLSYKDAGVDIDAGNKFVKSIMPAVASTANGLGLGGIGSFAGAIRIPQGFSSPVILAATDGVGTKLRLAIDMQMVDGLGQDLVAMCVNDLICNFATPIAFLDYYASAKLDLEVGLKIVRSIADGCRQAGCELIGGETAEMPGVYQQGDFDLAGFAIGIAEEKEIDRRAFVKASDVLVALPSSGFHSNGYSLVRKAIDKLGLDLKAQKIGDQSLAELILSPTRIYVKEFMALKPQINALAHITGGGIVENLPRVLPKGLGARIDKSSIKTPKIFEIFQDIVSQEELYRTFNMGVGMVLVVSRENLDHVLGQSDGYVIGEIIAQDGILWS